MDETLTNNTPGDVPSFEDVWQYTPILSRVLLSISTTQATVNDLNIPAIIFLPPIVVITFGGNILTIATILSWRQLRDNIACWFLVSLALSDLLVSILVMPFNAAEVMVGYWSFGNFCTYFVGLDIMLSTVSIINLSIIAFDRYLAIAHPLEYQVWMSKKKAICTIISAWILAILLAFVPILMGVLPTTDKSEGYPGMAICELRLTNAYAIASSCISFFIPSIIMLLAYFRIYSEASKHFRRMRNHSLRIRGYKRRHKAAITLGIVTGVFVLLWTPFFFVNCIRSFHPSKIGDELFLTVTWLGWINSGVNPMIYSTNTEIRAGMKRFLCRTRIDSRAINSTTGNPHQRDESLA